MKHDVILIAAIGLLILNGVLTGVLIQKVMNDPEEKIVNSEMKFREEFMVKSKDGTIYLVTTRLKLRPTEPTSHEDIAKTMQYYLERIFLTSDDIALEQESQCLFLVKSAIAMTMDKFKYSSATEVIEIKRL
jgi:hypothetical protein